MTSIFVSEEEHKWTGFTFFKVALAKRIPKVIYLSGRILEGSWLGGGGVLVLGLGGYHWILVSENMHVSKKK